MKRREFLAASSCAAASWAAPWVHAADAAPVPPADTVNLALIGAGVQGKVLLNAARLVPGVRFLAVCDIWSYACTVAQRYLTRYGHGVNTYSDYREMLDKELALHGVLIATPDAAHLPQATACLEKGLHVYCEPMLSESLEGARQLVRAAQRSGKLLQVGFQRRSNPRYQHVYQRLLQEAQLAGPLTAVQTQWAQEAAELRGWPQRETIPDQLLRQYGYRDMSQLRNWTWYPEHSAGPFGQYAVHQLDVCCWFIGHPPSAVTCSGGRDFYTDRDHWDTVMSTFEFPVADRPGPLRTSCHVLTNTSGGGMRQFERFLGKHGSLQVSENPHWTRVGREANAPDWDQWVRKGYVLRPEASPGGGENVVHVSGELERFELPPLQTDMNSTPHVANFCDAIRGASRLACPAELAWPSHVAVWRALESARQQRRLALGREEYRL